MIIDNYTTQNGGEQSFETCTRLSIGKTFLNAVWYDDLSKQERMEVTAYKLTSSRDTCTFL